jgi:hypothetical protein
VFSKDHHAEGMERGYHEVGEFPLSEGLQPILHFPGSLIGEGHGQDRLLWDSSLKHVCDPMGNHPGLPGSSSCQNQEGTFKGGDRLPLGWIQGGK